MKVLLSFLNLILLTSWINANANNAAQIDDAEEVDPTHKPTHRPSRLTHYPTPSPSSLPSDMPTLKWIDPNTKATTSMRLHDEKQGFRLVMSDEFDVPGR